MFKLIVFLALSGASGGAQIVHFDLGNYNNITDCQTAAKKVAYARIGADTGAKIDRGFLCVPVQ